MSQKVRPSPLAAVTTPTAQNEGDPTAAAMPRLLLSVEQAAQALSIGQTLAYELIASGELPCVRIGRRTLVPVRALSEWVDRMALASRMATPAAKSTGTGAKATVTNELGNPRTHAEAS